MTENNHNTRAPAYLSPKKVADELGISLTAVYALIHSGDLRALNVAPSSGQGKKKSYRIGRAAFDEFKRGRQVKPSAPEPSEPQSRRPRRGRGLTEVPNYLGF